jgi:hypothetical protein
LRTTASGPGAHDPNVLRNDHLLVPLAGTCTICGGQIASHVLNQWTHCSVPAMVDGDLIDEDHAPVLAPVFGTTPHPEWSSYVNLEPAYVVAWHGEGYIDRWAALDELQQTIPTVWRHDERGGRPVTRQPDSVRPGFDPLDPYDHGNPERWNPRRLDERCHHCGQPIVL